MTNLPVPQFPTVSQPMLIEHSLDGGDIVHQRPQDGYVNATELCARSGKQFGHYRATAQAQAFLDALSLEIGIPISNLVQVIRGRGDKVVQGTWVHPQVAINLGQWLSPTFAVQVSKWVFDWMAGKTNPYMPVHVQRYLKNRAKIPPTHFSMLNEIYLNLIAPLEDYGIVLPDKMMPDASTGRMFSGFLRRKGIAPEQFPNYQHEFVDSLRPVVYARLYPNEYLPDFRRYFHEEWLPVRADKYFQERFPEAVPYLPVIHQLPPGVVVSGSLNPPKKT